MSHLKDQVVLVSGAGSGIGLAIVSAFVNAGAKVVCIGRNLEKLQNATSQLPTEQILCFSCDVSNRDSVAGAIQQTQDSFGTVTILVNNAGINSNPRTVNDIHPDEWDKVLQINLTGTYNMVRATLNGMREQKSGTIINIASTAGLRASKLSGAAYAASKHGVVSLTHNINEEEWEHGIRAVAICPGEVNTPMLDKRTVPVSANRRAEMLQPEDIAKTVLFIAGLPSRVHIPIVVMKPAYQLFS